MNVTPKDAQNIFDMAIELGKARETIAAQAAELERYEIARQEDAKRIDAQAATIAKLAAALAALEQETK